MVKSLRTLIPLVALVCLPLARPAAAFPGPQGGAGTFDGRLQAQVEKELDKKGFRTITVAVSDGVVTLTGEVQHLYGRTQAVTIAGKVKDVKSVVDQLAFETGISDVSVAEGVAREVRSYPRFGVFDDISVRARNGSVELMGAVTDPSKARDIEQRIMRVPGVHEVKSSIVVLATSPGDDQIRYLTANRLYGDPMFEQYASMSNPPIHIIVDRGHVTLTGAVGTQMEKQKAEMIARGVFGVFSVTNRLFVER